MQIKTNSPLGWIIHIVVSALMGWFFGFCVISGVISLLFAQATPEWIRVVLAIAVGGSYLYCYRKGVDTAFPFKNGGWLK